MANTLASVSPQYFVVQVQGAVKKQPTRRGPVLIAQAGKTPLFAAREAVAAAAAPTTAASPLHTSTVLASKDHSPYANRLRIVATIISTARLLTGATHHLLPPCSCLNHKVHAPPYSSKQPSSLLQPDTASLSSFSWSHKSSLMLVLLVAVVSAVVAEKSAVDLSRLPDGFLMGTATSAYQTEGAWNEDGKGESIWDNLVHRNPNYSVDCSNGDVAADSYHKYRRDVTMLKELGVDVYRFSVSWPRIMPTGDPTEINDKGVAHYDALINLLLENGITPMVTMYHWDLPQRLQDLGGWANPIMAYYFEEYANVLFTKFGDRVKWWVTINEPEHIAAGYEPALSVYVPSVAPGLPGHPGVGSYLAAHTMLLAHSRAYRLYNTTFRHRQHGRLGLALSAVHIQPASDAPEDVAAARRLFQFQVRSQSRSRY
ncbi:myrosinase 1-like [Schistocerca serialis cubense]|uniref:myrosinase 1-like n=1 Tax=Schistocerca serialis cubense TaxID=2023355 RepID=UPI00214E9361|nr:myrosinase 1-like [Schistocerca serialis cubense]